MDDSATGQLEWWLWCTAVCSLVLIAISDECSANDAELLRCPPPAMTDPSIGAGGNIPDADDRSCQPTAGLYGNSTLVGIPAYLMRGLESALNTTWLIFHLRLSDESDHGTDALVSRHWLRVPERIQFKIAVLTCRVLHGDAPCMVSGAVHLYC